MYFCMVIFYSVETHMVDNNDKNVYRTLYPIVLLHFLTEINSQILSIEIHQFSKWHYKISQKYFEYIFYR